MLLYPPNIRGPPCPEGTHHPESEGQDAEGWESIYREVHGHFLYLPERLIQMPRERQEKIPAPEKGPSQREPLPRARR